MVRSILMAVLVMVATLASDRVLACEIGGQEVACPTRNGHYRIRLPRTGGPYPTVVYLYGSTGNSQRILANDDFVQAFVERGYAVIVPAALDLRYKTGIDSGWYLRNESARKRRNDTRFIEEVLDNAEIRHRIDRKRVLIAGMSRGGFLTWDIACHAPGLASAFAPIAAGYLGDLPKRCAGPVRLLHTHGRADTVVSLNSSNRWQSGGARMAPLGASLDTLGASSGCIARGAEDKLREYDRTTWDGCPNGSSVSVLVHDGGHTIPLSWYSTVIDWFESDRTAPVTGPTGGTARFKSVTNAEGPRLGTRTGSASRFKPAKVPSQ